MSERKIMPFLKWPGGKRWLAEKLVGTFPEINKYIEPFLGSGAVFFVLAPSKAIISDINKELIETYIAMKNKPNALKQKLLYHQKKHSKNYYYKIRNTKPRTEINRAARFIYLNRTCFNGLYRVNRKGEFNVPIGTKKNCIYDIEYFEDYSERLTNTDIKCCDFEVAITFANKKDLIFADPPYAMDNAGNFIKYNDKLFTWDDQERLLKSLIAARDRGANIVVTNAYCDAIKKMYEKEGFYIYEIERLCSVAGKAESRKMTKEYLITSYLIKENEENNDKNCNY